MTPRKSGVSEQGAAKIAFDQCTHTMDMEEWDNQGKVWRGKARLQPSCVIDLTTATPYPEFYKSLSKPSSSRWRSIHRFVTSLSFRIVNHSYIEPLRIDPRGPWRAVSVGRRRMRRVEAGSPRIRRPAVVACDLNLHLYACCACRDATRCCAYDIA
ncbi:hypothetical protein LZ32DRAFT_40810 [Colletotrichum eremochloae]|nr:hypothetical protein LZ32DRAFT_40810 [Colletotrichum eremochloae]